MIAEFIKIYCLTNKNQAIGKNTKNIINIVSAEAPPGDIPSCLDACFPFFTGLKQLSGSSGLKQQSFKGIFHAISIILIIYLLYRYSL